MAKRPTGRPTSRSRSRSDGRRPKRFEPEMLDSSIIAFPLLDWLRDEPKTKQANEARELPGRWRPTPRPGCWQYAVVIDLHLGHPPPVAREEGEPVTVSGLEVAKSKVIELVEYFGGAVSRLKTELSVQYVIASMTGDQIFELIQADRERGGHRAVYRIWPDFKLEPHINRTVRTIKCDAARISFSATGEGVVWAVMDSGIDRRHPQFRLHANLGSTAAWKTAAERAQAAREAAAAAAAADPPASDAEAAERQALEQAVVAAEKEEAAAARAAAGDSEVFDHQDFTDSGDPLADDYGHGTHVAGILAGELPSTEGAAFYQVTRSKDEHGEVRYERKPVGEMAGMAPRCRLVSLKVLDGKGDGLVSNLIAAIGYLQKVNGYGRLLVVHGVNMSVGYDFDPEWFACGQSPLCIEVDRLVRSGVVVVVAAGNTGYGFNQVKGVGLKAAALDLTINDPGNAELAITVGSTHRDSPHVYGVSYFSSKGPTGDGRLKPDLLAPGERILSCAAGVKSREAEAKLAAQLAADAAIAAAGGGAGGGAGAGGKAAGGGGIGVHYLEDSGTSMSAPHVSGAIAAFLSVREEFKSQPGRVKEIFLDTATDLGRERYFQGNGLVDLMRAIQSV